MRYFFVSPWKFDKTSSLRTLCEEFRERISRYVPAAFEQPRSMPDSEEAATQFLTGTCKKHASASTLLVCLDEKGEEMSSEGFAEFLRSQELKSTQKIIFCVGGAYGLPAELATDAPPRLLALSSLTFSHELAMLVLLEQVYRARTIIANHPYHHGAPSSLTKKLRKD